MTLPKLDGNMTLYQFARELWTYEKRIHDEFKAVRRRRPELSDKCKKIFEEQGEFIEALDRWNATTLRTTADSGIRHHVLEENVDTAVAVLSQALILEYSAEELAHGLVDVLGKLRERWGPGGTGRRIK